MQKPTFIFDIKKYAINDGPGIRTTVFLKGCSLNCEWCHNPESIPSQQQKMFSANKCIGSKKCIKHCPNNALTLTSKGIITNFDLCTLCGKCAEVCPTKAIEIVGKEMTVEDVMKQIKREVFLMNNSEGGVTFSGGEPLLHHQYLIKLLDACGKEGIHRCIDTSGYASSNILMKIASKSELFLYDLKMTNDEKHKKWTGVSNKKILKNLKILAEMDKDIIIRIPLIGGVNDDDENIQNSAKFINSLNGKAPLVNILPFHNIAENKYKKLGINQPIEKIFMPTKERQNEILEIFKLYNINAELGG